MALHYTDKYLIVDTREAAIFGIASALVLARIKWGLGIYENDSKDRDEVINRDGRNWVRVTVNKLVEDIKPFTKRSIERAIKSLRDSGVLLSAHYARGCDRTNYYAIDYDVLNKVMSEKYPDYSATNIPTLKY